MIVRVGLFKGSRMKKFNFGSLFYAVLGGMLLLLLWILECMCIEKDRG